MTDIAPLAYQVDTSDIVKATSDLDKHAAAASKTDKSAAALISSMASVARAMGVVVNAVNANNQALVSNSKALNAVKSDTDSVDSSVDRLTASYNALRSSLDPVFAASKSYEAALETVNSALSRGVISQTEANRVLAMAESRFLMAGQNAMVAGHQIGAANHHITNMGFQLQDIGVMLAAGQSPLMLAMQQGTQVAGIFNQMKAEGQSAFAALRGGMSALLGPTTLLTVGAIALGAALFQLAGKYVDLNGKGADFADNLSAAADAVSAYSAAADMAKKSTSDLVQEFGFASPALKETLSDLAMIAQLEAHKSIQKLNESVADLVLSASWMKGSSVDVAEIFNIPIRTGAAYKDMKNDIAGVKSLFDQMVNGGSLDEMYQAAIKLRAEFKANVDVNGKLTEEQQAFWTAISKSLRQMESLRGASGDVAGAIDGAVYSTSDWSGAMAGVRVEINAIAAVIASLGGGAIQAGAKQTEILALRAGKSIKEAAIAASEFRENIAVENKVQGLVNKYGVLGEVMGVAVRAGAEANRNLDRTLEAEREIAIERERAEAAAARTGRGGGGRGGGSGGGAASRLANERARELETLVESLLTERQIVEQWNNEQLELINQYTDAELMAIGGRNGAKLRLEMEYQEKLRAIHQEEAQRRISDASGLFGALAQIAAAGGEKTVKAVAAFQAIEGTINAYGAAIKALNTPGISLAGRFAAYASVLAAGLKGVAAIKSAGSGGGGGGGGGSGAGAPSSVSGTTPTATPTRSVMVSFDGPDWWRQMAESMMTQIYDQTADGTRVVFER